MGTIIVRWVPDENFSRNSHLIVIVSNHHRFAEGEEFDFEFIDDVSIEGYTIVILPRQ